MLSVVDDTEFSVSVRRIDGSFRRNADKTDVLRMLCRLAPKDRLNIHYTDIHDPRACR